MKPGFDHHNLKIYRFLLSFIALVSAFVVILTLMGRAPGFSIDPAVTAWSYAGAFLAAMIGHVLMSKERMPVIYAAMIPTLLFGAAGYVSGLPPVAALLVMGGSLAVILASLLLGSRADLRSETRTIKIRLPWT